MVRKSLITSLLSFVIYFIPAFFIWYYKEQYKSGSSFLGTSAFEFFFYSSPVIIITFLLLLAFNFWFSRNLNNRSSKQNGKLYFLFTGGFAIILTLGLTLFDYFQFNKPGSDGNFLHILARYSELFLFILVVLILNRKIYFSNFN